MILPTLIFNNEPEKEVIKTEGFAIIQVGRTSGGKSHTSKEMLNDLPKDKEIFIYDVNNEYKQFYSKPFVPFNTFMDQFYVEDEENEVIDAFILFEEATIFFKVKATDKVLTNLLVRKRHTGNIIILNFHSFGKIPPYVFDLVNYVTIFKTIDTLAKVKSRTDNELLIDTFEEIKALPNLYNEKDGKEYSPSKTVSLY
jgi:hypothetical protein